MSEQKMREALKMALEQMEHDWKKIDGEWGPSHGGIEVAIVNGDAEAIRIAREALAEQPAQGVPTWPMKDEAGLPLYAILAAWADAEERTGGRGKAKALRAASRALDPSWKSCGRPDCTAPPAPSVPPPMPLPETSTGNAAEDMRLFGKAQGWNLCRAAMLAPAPEVKS